MFASIRSLGVSGVGGYGVTVEVNITTGMPAFDVVGLPDAAVKEARERVRAAVKNSGYRFPVSRLTVNLAPADRKKAGTVYDLPVLIGILSASGDMDCPGQDCAFFGELSLNGALRPVSGALPMAIAAERLGVRKLFVPADNAAEAAFAQGEEWQRQMLAYLAGNVQTLKDFLVERLPKVKAVLPEASYLAWLDFNAYGIPHKTLAERFIQEARVVMNDGTTFGGKEYEGCFRLNIGCPRAQMLDALDRIANAINKQAL